MEPKITLPEEGSPMFLALNQALGEQKMIQARQRFACAQGLLGQDTKRPKAWQAFGWPEQVDFHNFHRLWARGGLAHGAINRIVNKCWQDMPEIIEGEPSDEKRPPTQWEKAFKVFAKQCKLWSAIKEADKRRLVGHYSALVLQIADGKKWNEPVRGRTAKRLVKIIPAWENQLIVSSWGMDEQDSINYGEPTMYTFREKAIGVETNPSSASYAGRSVEVHPDRVIIIGSILDGVPALRAAFNDFVNIEKILGGSGESFLKNASRQIAINFGKDADLGEIASAHGVPLKGLKSLFDEVTHGLNQGIDQTLITKNATVQPIVTTVPDPQQHFLVSLQSAAASLEMPIMVWIGSQTGERSSTEDQKDWNKTNQGRREHTLSFDLEMVVAHLMRIGLVKQIIETAVIWSDLSEATQGEKLDNALKMGLVNEKFLPTGEHAFSAQEARTVAGFDNGESMEVEDEDPEGDDDGDLPEPKAVA